MKEFHVYDSFEGLPEKSSKDSSPAGMQFKAGELKASKKIFIDNYKKAGMRLPFIHKCWFNEIDASNIPEEISFAFLDGDYHDSIKSCLNLIEDKITRGGVVIVDDYQNEALPGAKKAVDEWLAHKNYSLKIEQSLAIIKIA
jgi:O-methyltransferase